ncbi:MAG TPA: metallophosphoesterase [Planctomycetota bacterium]
MKTRHVIFLCMFLAAAVLAGEGKAPRNVTFFSTSDSHYRCGTNTQNNEWDHETIEQMNQLPGQSWPEALGGDRIEPARGVVVLGDCIDDGDKTQDGVCVTELQYKAFAADFGLDGTDGALRFPVFETWGNHDGPPAGKGKCGFSFQEQLKKRNEVRKSKQMIQNLSYNGLHYSWDWGDVHFLQLGIYPADKQREGVRYSAQWHDPQNALTFMKEDLAKNVGASGRPVVLMAHCGFDTNWWVVEDWKDAYDAAKPYNVILYVYGHTGTGLRDWAPEGEAKKWTCINDGQTTAGFFVIQIIGDRLRAAYRTRANAKLTKRPDGTMAREWGGLWDWKYTLNKKLAQ